MSFRFGLRKKKITNIQQASTRDAEYTKNRTKSSNSGPFFAIFKPENGDRRG